MIQMAFLGGTVGPTEMLVVLIAVLLLFGPDRLPELARRIGRFMNQIRDASDEVRRQVLNPPEEKLPGPPPLSPTEPDSKPSEEKPHDQAE